ncbi:hypothetical protein [Poseidonibacter lekithochrous]|uniref:hypothetical protein n=1 Tax=Poseidonibacter lekithochrous TaxID=1904463 RepID=UPI000D3658FF|nr:hypothetical protein [Poseidonibacter lekithochrous]
MSKCEEEFNPWPSFVDIFSSVILVMLLFLLVLLVNLGFYAQFKYKVSYTGSITTDELILNSTPSPLKVDNLEQKEEQKEESTQTIVQEMQAEVVRLRKIIEERTIKAKELNEAEIEAGGIDVADRNDDDKAPKQLIVEAEDYFIVTFKKNEIFFDNGITKELKIFIKNAQEKYENHKITISASDIKGRASATVAKQVSLARSIGARNLIRKLGYEKRDVRIDLLSDTKVKEQINDENGYLLIRIKK